MCIYYRIIYVPFDIYIEAAFYLVTLTTNFIKHDALFQYYMLNCIMWLVNAVLISFTEQAVVME